MNDVTELLKVLFPLIFLVVWALSSLFNRETRPVPTRTGQGLGPRPGPPPGPRPMERAPAGTSTSRPPNRSDEEILIIRPETLRQTRPTQSVSTARRQARPKAAPSIGSRRQETPSRPLSAPSGLYLTPQQIGLAVELEPLGKQSVLTPQKGTSGALASAAPPRVEPAGSADQWRGMMGSPARLREAFVLSELLGPPLAHRPRHRG